MIDRLHRDAVLVLGFSESERFGSPFAKEMESFIDGNIDIVRLGDALDEPDKHGKMFKERLVVTHSAGILAVREAQQIMTLNPVEPRPLYKIIKGAHRVGTDKYPDEEQGIIVGGLVEPIREVLRHPILNLKVMLATTHHSTVHELIANPNSYPMGRMMFPMDQDQFRFGGQKEVDLARSYGVHAELLKGKHNHPLFQPRDTIEQIKRSLNYR